MKRFLIVGASGVAGRAGIEAIRQHFGDESHITALWFGRGDPETPVEGADLSLYGDIAEAATARIREELMELFRHRVAAPASPP